MEFESGQLDKAVYYILTLHPNDTLTSVQIFEYLLADNVYKGFTNNTRRAYDTYILQVSDSMNNIHDDYKNITFVDEMISLRVNDDSDSDSANNNNNYDLIDLHDRSIHTTYNTPVQSTDIGTLSFENKNFDTKYSVLNGDTIIHNLCRYGKYERLYDAAEVYDFDMNCKNDNNETILDVISENDKKTAEALLKIMIKQLHEKNNALMVNVKATNTSLLNENGRLSHNLCYLNNKLKNNSKYINILLFINVVLMCGIAACVYIFLK
jgi:hypothetical protein